MAKRASRTDAATLLVRLNTSSQVAEEMEQLTRQLRDELLELNIKEVALVRAGKTPAKAKAGDPIIWGSLLLTLASGGVLTGVITFLQSWLSRRDQRKISLEINGDKLELTGISSKEQKRLIDLWLRRNSRIVTPDD